MKNFSEEITLLLQNENLQKEELKDFIINHTKNNIENQKEFINLLPFIIQNTNEQNLYWMHYIHNYCNIKGFLDSFIDNIFLFDFRRYHFLFMKILKELKSTSIEKKHIYSLLEKALNNDKKVYWEDIYNMIKDIYPDIIPDMLTPMLNNKKTYKEAISLIQKDNNQYIYIIYDNIDRILKNIDHDEDVFELKEIVKNNKEAQEKVVNRLRINSKENIKKLIRALYLRVVIFKSDRHDISYVYDKKFDTILEIIYLIIEDICKNEKVDITDIESIGSGAYSSVLSIGDKVIKIGLGRETDKFPNNPYINSMLLRKELPITEKDSFFVEVSEKVDTKSEVDDEELYQLYKKLRNIGLVWLDTTKRNVGRLLKDNKIHWRSELPITDESLGLAPYRKAPPLKKGDIVILDNDLIYDINDSNIPGKFSTFYQLVFEKRYQEEEKNSPQYGGKLILKKEKLS